MYQTGIRSLPRRILAYAATAIVAFGMLSFSHDARALSACETSYNAILSGSDGCCQLVWQDPDNSKTCPAETDPTVVSMCFNASGAVKFGTGREAFACKAKAVNKAAIESCRLRGGIFYSGAVAKEGGLNCGCPAGTIVKQGSYQDSKGESWPGCVPDTYASTPVDTGTQDNRSIGVTFKPQVSIPFSTDFIRGKDVSVDGALIARYVKAVYSFFLAVTGFIAVVMFMVAGVQYMVSRDTKGAQAKETMKNAALGLLAMFVTYQVLNTISGALVEFKSLDVVPVKGESVQAKNGSCYQFEEMSKNFSTDLAETDKITNYFFTSSKLPWYDADTIGILGCHPSRKSVPVWYKDTKSGEMKEAGSCSAHLCPIGKVCFGYACKDFSDGVFGGRVTNGEIEIGIFGSSRVFVDNVVAIKVPRDQNGPAAGFWKCADAGNSIKVNLSGNAFDLSCVNASETYNVVTAGAPGWVQNKFNYFAQSIGSDDLSETDSSYQIISYDGLKDLSFADRFIILANLHTTESETTHCEVSDGASPGSLNNDDRWVAVSKTGGLADVIGGSNAADYFYSVTDAFLNCTEDACQKSSIDLKQNLAQLNVDVSSYKYASFCALNHP